MNKVTKGRDRQGQWWLVIIDYLGGECSYCGTKDDLTINHIIPLQNGGSNTMANLEIACRKCHIILTKQARNIFNDTRKRKPRKTECPNGHHIFRGKDGKALKCLLCAF